MLRAAFADLPLRRKGVVVVAVPAVALVVMAVSLAVLQHTQRVATGWVRQTLEVQGSLDTVLEQLVTAESGIRGYLLSEKPALLASYLDARRRLPAVLSDLARQVQDNPGQSDDERLLEAVIARRMQYLERLRLMAASTPETDPNLEPTLEQDADSMNTVRSILSRMLAREKELLNQRRAGAERVSLSIYLLLAACVAAGLAGGLFSGRLFGAFVARRIDVLGRNARRLAERQPLEPMPRGNDELGALGNELARTDALLAKRERELHAAEQFEKHLIETSPTVITRQDPATFAVTYVSPNVEEILGYRREELLRSPRFWIEHVHPADRDRVVHLDDAAIARLESSLITEYRFQHKAGGYRWLRSFVRLEYEEGQPASLFAHRLDITEEKRAEEALLERQQRLDATNRELEAFSYSVSHDLRAPLRSIDGFSLALVEDYGAQLDPSARDYLLRVRAASQRMGALIDDLLKLSRVSRAPLQKQSIDLSQIAGQVLAELREAEPKRSVETLVEPGMQDNGDPGLLRVVLQNLLGNAWKFTGRSEHARIEFRRAMNGDVPAYVVRDNGAGFDSTYASKLFGAFQRLHNPQDYPGTGIGLATVQRIVHRHGGEVWAEGATGKGAAFYFTLQP